MLFLKVNLICYYNNRNLTIRKILVILTSDQLSSLVCSSGSGTIRYVSLNDWYFGIVCGYFTCHTIWNMNSIRSWQCFKHDGHVNGSSSMGECRLWCRLYMVKSWKKMLQWGQWWIPESTVGVYDVVVTARFESLSDSESGVLAEWFWFFQSSSPSSESALEIDLFIRRSITLSELWFAALNAEW